jgi:hypothetical protein
MSRLSRYRRGSLVPHLIALTLLLTLGLFGAGGSGDDLLPGAHVARAATLTGAPAGDPAGDRIEALDTVITPGERTYLEPNFPNPVAENRTTIAFTLADEMMVTVKIYDMWYNEVATLFDNELLAAGRHYKLLRWGPGTTVQPLFSGMYFYELRAGGETHRRRMLVIK